MGKCSGLLKPLIYWGESSPGWVDLFPLSLPMARPGQASPDCWGLLSTLLFPPLPFPSFRWRSGLEGGVCVSLESPEAWQLGEGLALLLLWPFALLGVGKRE